MRREPLISDYPFVLVRIACRRCLRKGSYRLARLADKYGSEYPLDRLIVDMSADCKARTMRALNITGEGGCKAFLPDLEPGSPPPDLPPGMIGIRLVWRRDVPAEPVTQRSGRRKRSAGG